MLKDTASLFIAAISVIYILFAGPAYADVPPSSAVPYQVAYSSCGQSDAACLQKNTPAVNRNSPARDSSRWRLLSTNEIKRLLTIHTSE